MNLTRSASNAVKHGLTSRTFVPDHARAMVEEIRLELAAVHEPKSGEENQLVAELAIALWQNYEHDRKFYERQAYEETIADTVFNDQAQNAFESHLKNLPTTPLLLHRRLTESCLGSLHLQGLFQSALEALSNDHPLSFQQITDCMNAIGLDWRLDSLSAGAGPLMGLHMALVDDPEKEILQWLEASQPRSPQRAESVARHYHAQAPNTEVARRELLTRLGAELEQVTSRIHTLEEAQEHRRRLFKSANAGYGLDDPRATRSAMLAQRYRTAAFNRSVRIQNELKSLQAERLTTAPTSVYAYRLPAARQAEPPAPVKSQVIIENEFTDIQKSRPTPSVPSLRNEPPARPFKPLVRAKTSPKITPPPISNRKAQLARLAKQA